MEILYCIKVISDTRGLILRTKGSKLKAVELINSIQLLRATWFDDSVEIHVA